MSTRLNNWPIWLKSIDRTEATILPAKSHTIKHQLEWATAVLYSISCSAALDSEVLLAHCLQKNRSYLLTWPERELTAEQLEQFHELVRKRLQPQPVAYLIGSREFYSMDLNTTSDTLVPRPETELLVESVLDLIVDLTAPKILELGTGTGAISLAIKKHASQSDIVATDISEAALQVARSNALKHHLDIGLIESDWYQALIPAKFDIIVSNPPYIASDDPYLSQGDLPAEPIQALCSGKTGLEALSVIIQGGRDYLNDNGWILLEHGYDQEQAVTDIFKQYGYHEISTLRDFNDLPRVTRAKY